MTHTNSSLSNLSPVEANLTQSEPGPPVRIKPQSPLRLLADTVRLYGRCLPEFIAIAALGYLLQVTVLLLAVAGYQQIGMSAVAQAMLSALLLVGGIALLAMTQAVVTATVSLIAVQKKASRPTSVTAALRGAMRKFGSLAAMLAMTLLLAIAALIVAGIPIVGAMLAPGLLVFAAILSLVTPVVIVLEQLPATPAVARAWGLVRRHLLRLFVVMAVLGVIAALVFGLPALGLLALGLSFQVTDIWLPLLPGVFFAPLLSAGALLLYVDLRSRAEETLTWQSLYGPLTATNAASSTLHTSPGHGGLMTLAEAGQLVVVSLLITGIVGLLALSGAGVLWSGTTVDGSPAAVVTVGSIAPDFSLATLTEEPVSLHQLRGKPTVINFWATWCPPCREELPALEAAHARYGDRVNFLAVDVEEDAATVRRFADQFGLTLPVLLDVDGAVMDMYQVRGLPTTLFVNAEGVIVNYHMGGLTDSSLADYLQPLLEE